MGLPMFIVIDGPDGSGKTTLAKKLTQKICQKGFKAIYTREPTDDSDAGKKIRSMLQGGEVADVYAFADLFVADRKEHLVNLIEPCLLAGRWVVCDRYKYSALAYQQLQGVDPQYLIKKNQECLIPDFVFILLPKNTDVLMSRIAQRGAVIEMFEKKEFLVATVCYYRTLKVYFPDENIWYLDADDSLEKNLGRILEIVKFNK